MPPPGSTSYNLYPRVTRKLQPLDIIGGRTRFHRQFVLKLSVIGRARLLGLHHAAAQSTCHRASAQITSHGGSDYFIES